MTDPFTAGGRALRRWQGVVITGLLLALFSSLAGTAGAAQSGPTSQCVACHTDAAKLKALTPPDPPAGEEGEG